MKRLVPSIAGIAKLSGESKMCLPHPLVKVERKDFMRSRLKRFRKAIWEKTTVMTKFNPYQPYKQILDSIIGILCTRANLVLLRFSLLVIVTGERGLQSLA